MPSPSAAADVAIAAVNKTCEVCFVVTRSDVAHVPCGHAILCCDCANTVFAMGRASIEVAMRANSGSYACF